MRPLGWCVIMVETAGTKLKRARQLRQLSIEDASRATKIRARQLAELEADDYSNFANLAYARSFLVAYGKYLHVDTRPYMESFADAGTFGMDDYQYLNEEPLGMYRSTRRTVRRKPKRHQLVAACAVAGLLAVGLFGRVVYNTYERLGDVEKIAARREAHAHGKDGKAGAVTVDQAPADGDAAAQPSPAGPATVPVTATPVPDRRSPVADGARLAAAPDAATGPHASVELPALTAAPAQDPATVAAVPLPGDGTAVREMMSAPLARKPVYGQTASATHPAPVFHIDEPQPQKVVNNDPGRPVN